MGSTSFLENTPGECRKINRRRLWFVLAVLSCLLAASAAQENPTPRPKPKPKPSGSETGPTTSGSKRRPAAGGSNKSSRDAEVVFWDSIKNSADPEDYKAYLRKYPNGVYADLARKRAGLNAPAASVSRPRSAINIEFVKIPAGEFMMGTDEVVVYSRKYDIKNDDERPAHRVVISRGFEMGKYEVTQAQWEALMGSNPSQFKGADLPVENVSWDDVQYFLQAMNAKNDGYAYRLPTEAEWEYACRAGSAGPWAGYLDGMAWYGDNSGRERLDAQSLLETSDNYSERLKSNGCQTHPVGHKKPNVWGLCDMHGNVWEWCSDWYDHDYYRNSPMTDPQGSGTGSHRVDRGGGWENTAAACRSAFRYGHSPGGRFGALGFRLVRTPR